MVFQATKNRVLFIFMPKCRVHGKVNRSSRGCDGSVLISGTSAERNTVTNTGLRGFEVIDNAKTQLEASCPSVVSCADILALAARDAVDLTGGPSWGVPTGRRDGRISSSSEALNLPSPLDTIDVQRNKFAAKGLDDHELVTLTACPQNGDGLKKVALDKDSQMKFDVSFFKNVRNGNGILESDQRLLGDPSTKKILWRNMQGL
ncbi:hypothetical protein RND71_034220 [Anisodus tanguticus]|uniref:peroxidase n=1 Tax=Anisodus tanguticus TaxID=243964 RepID=A0AAE1R9Q9_9SOLA|nr:hypothetical protein RND71_034220 [Anisodus tanguticus]